VGSSLQSKLEPVIGIKTRDKVLVLTELPLFFQLAKWKLLTRQPVCNPCLSSYLKCYVAFAFSCTMLLSSAAWRAGGASAALPLAQRCEISV